MAGTMNETFHAYSGCTMQTSLLDCSVTKNMLLESIREAGAALRFELVAYVICRAEFHLILRIFEGGTPLPRIMKDIKYRFSRKYNAGFGTSGTTWSRRYGKKRIDSTANPDAYFKWLIAKLAEASEMEYVKGDRFSSLRQFYEPGCSPMLATEKHRVFEDAGKTDRERRREFRRYREIYMETKFLDP